MKTRPFLADVFSLTAVQSLSSLYEIFSTAQSIEAFSILIPVLKLIYTAP